jgi:hypothetical protein
MPYYIRKDLKVTKGCLYLVPLGDFHIGSQEFTTKSEKKLQGYIDWILARPNAVTILMGDLMNCSTVVSPGRPFEERLNGTEQLMEAKRLLEPLAKEKRILCSIMGNHEFQYMNAIGTRLDRNLELCTLLGVEYGGVDAYISLNLQITKTMRMNYDIYITHGFGGGRKDGQKINNVEDLIYIAESDLYMMGHVHSCFGNVTTRFAHEGRRLIEKQVAYCLTGSFLQYMQVSSNIPSYGYAARKALRPVRIGAPRIRFEARDGRKDIHISI